MDENVMATYTTKSTEALHYIQYDQGAVRRGLCVRINFRWSDMGMNIFIINFNFA